MNIQEFLAKQEQVYDKFRSSSEQIQREGVKPHGLNGKGGYLIAFRHPDEIAEAAGTFSTNLAQFSPLMVFHPGNIHTTISDYQLGVRFSPDLGVLNRLVSAVRETGRLAAPTIEYNEWLFNQSTLIAAGTPNEAFLEISQRIVDSAKKESLELRLPWGAHITIARFTRPQTYDELAGFRSFLENAALLGTSRPACIDVGHMTFKEDTFEFTSYERFELE